MRRIWLRETCSLPKNGRIYQMTIDKFHILWYDLSSRIGNCVGAPHVGGLCLSYDIAMLRTIGYVQIQFLSFRRLL